MISRNFSLSGKYAVFDTGVLVILHDGKGQGPSFFRFVRPQGGFAGVFLGRLGFTTFSTLNS